MASSVRGYSIARCSISQLSPEHNWKTLLSEVLANVTRLQVNWTPFSGSNSRKKKGGGGEEKGGGKKKVRKKKRIRRKKEGGK